jgi:hypothetical protein
MMEHLVPVFHSTPVPIDGSSKTLKGLRVGRSISHGPLYLFPLRSAGTGKEDVFLLLEDGLRNGTLRVEELDEKGSVPELRIFNEGCLPVLILEGDELVGAKQNRMVNSSVLVAAGSDLILPVSCVERGRWSYHSKVFTSGTGGPHIALRRLTARSVHESLTRGQDHTSDQGAVWREVDRKARLHEAASPTQALQDSRSTLSDRLQPFEELVDEIPERTCGVVVALGARPELLEVLSGPRSFASAARKLLSGYAFEALASEENGDSPDTSLVEQFISTAATAVHEEHRPVGSGRDLRFEAKGVSGYALIGESGVLHAAAFAD